MKVSNYIIELLKMNNYKAPRDKLICILNCCKVIFGKMIQSVVFVTVDIKFYGTGRINEAHGRR